MVRICENCEIEHDGAVGSGRFCSLRCSRSFSTKASREDINKKVSDKLKNRPNWVSSLPDDARSNLGKALTKTPAWKTYIDSRNQVTKDRMDLWYSGASDNPSPRLIRTYLIERLGPNCKGCNFSAKHPIDNNWIIELDHINGDHTDNAPSNLRLLCPNCHAMTPTCSGRNKRLKRLL